MGDACDTLYRGEFELIGFRSNGAIIEQAPRYKGLPALHNSTLTARKHGNKWIFCDGVMNAFDGVPDYAKTGKSISMEREIADLADGLYKQMANAITKRYLDICRTRIGELQIEELEGLVLLYDKYYKFCFYDKERDGIVDWFAVYRAGKKYPMVDIRGNDPTGSIALCNNILAEMTRFLKRGKF